MATKSTSAAASGAVVRRLSAAATVARKPSGGRAAGKSSILNFYTDDKPGLQISPVFVVAASVAFVAIVTTLHIIGKIRGL